MKTKKVVKLEIVIPESDQEIDDIMSDIFDALIEDGNIIDWRYCSLAGDGGKPVREVTEQDYKLFENL